MLSLPRFARGPRLLVMWRPSRAAQIKQTRTGHATNYSPGPCGCGRGGASPCTWTDSTYCRAFLCASSTGSDACLIGSVCARDMSRPPSPSPKAAHASHGSTGDATINTHTHAQNNVATPSAACPLDHVGAPATRWSSPPIRPLPARRRSSLGTSLSYRRVRAQAPHVNVQHTYVHMVCRSMIHDTYVFGKIITK